MENERVETEEMEEDIQIKLPKKKQTRKGRIISILVMIVLLAVLGYCVGYEAGMNNCVAFYEAGKGSAIVFAGI